LLFLAAWGAAAAAAVLDCGGCGAPVRAGLLVGLAASLAAGCARVLPLPGFGGVRALRCDDGRWQSCTGGVWEPVAVERAVEVLRGGWWLHLRGADPRRRHHWVWVDARRTPRGSYRALCRQLRHAPARRRPVAMDAAGRSRGTGVWPLARRRSRPDPPDGT
jgi:hypothetical protein